VSPAKRFLLTITSVYVVGAVAGLWLYRSPWYSNEYLARHGKDHERYHELLRDQDYQRYVQRPGRHAGNDAMAAAAAFVEEYERRPEFLHELHRVEGYSIYFRLLNSATVVVLIVRFGRKPVRDFLDARISRLANDLSGAEQLAKEARQLRDEAQHAADEWPDRQARIVRETDEAIDASLLEIREEYVQARAQLLRATVDRKQAEVLRAEQMVRRELIEQAMTILEERYRTQSAGESLSRSVDEFVRLMERLA